MNVFVGFGIHSWFYTSNNSFVFRDLISTLCFFAVKSKEIAFLMKNKEIFAKLLTKRKMSFILLSVNRRERVVAEQMRFQRAAGGGIAAGQNREWAFEGEPNSMTVGFDGGRFRYHCAVYGSTRLSGDACLYTGGTADFCKKVRPGYQER